MPEILLDTETASLGELMEVKAMLDRLIEEKRRNEKKAATRQIRELAKVHSLCVEEILQTRQKTPRGIVRPKYQHPSNPALRWTGRGRMPAWVTELIHHGVDLDALCLEKQALAQQN